MSKNKNAHEPTVLKEAMPGGGPSAASVLGGARSMVLVNPGRMKPTGPNRFLSPGHSQNCLSNVFCIKFCVPSSRQVVHALAKLWHRGGHKCVPCSWLPDLDADRRTNYHQFRVGLDREKLTKTLGHNEPSPFSQ